MSVANPNSCIRFPTHRRSRGVVDHCGDRGGILQEIPLSPATTTTEVLRITANAAAAAIIRKSLHPQTGIVIDVVVAVAAAARTRRAEKIGMKRILFG